MKRNRTVRLSFSVILLLAGALPVVVVPRGQSGQAAQLEQLVQGLGLSMIVTAIISTACVHCCSEGNGTLCPGTLAAFEFRSGPGETRTPATRFSKDAIDSPSAVPAVRGSRQNCRRYRVLLNSPLSI